MAKYRLIKHEFYYDFRDVGVPAFPSFSLPRPAIYLGVSIDAFVAYYVNEVDNCPLPLNQFFAYPIHSLYDGSVVRPNSFLKDLIQSDNIDCTDIEITGEWALSREDFHGVLTSSLEANFRLYFLERIN